MLKRDNNRGIAFFISLAILLLLSMGVIVVFLTAYNYTNISENQIRRLQAITLAESGLHYAYYKYRVGEDDDGNPTPRANLIALTLHPDIPKPAGMSIDVDFYEEISPSRIRIESKVTY